MDLVFMGTPDFAVPTLEALIQSEHVVKAVVTKPDKPKGRGGRLQSPPVKEKAEAHQIPVLQPFRVKEEGFVEELRAYRPEAIVVVAYGQILPESILNLPRYGCLNVHASLLPKLRGAAPIQWAVVNGETVSGVTIMRMDAGIDTGNMLKKSVIQLEEGETGGSLHDKLSGLGGPLIVEALHDLVHGNAREEKQKEEESSHAPMLTKQTGNVDFHKSAVEIERLVRGMNPWPSAYTRLNGKIIKLWKVKALPCEEKAAGNAGEVVLVTDKELHVQTGEGLLSLLELQMEGKKRMPVDEFLRGNSVKLNQELTS